MGLRTPVGMGMFMHLFVPRPKTQGGEPVFNLLLLLDEEAQKDEKYRALKVGAMEAIDEKFGAGKSKDAEFMRGIRSPFNKAETKSQYAGFTPGKMYIAPWTKTKPGLVDGNLRDILSPADVWAGQLVRCTVSPFAYQKGSNKGVNFMLNNVQVVKSDMPRMDNRINASQDFDKVGGDAMDGADTSGDSDIPF